MIRTTNISILILAVLLQNCLVCCAHPHFDLSDTQQRPHVHICDHEHGCHTHDGHTHSHNQQPTSRHHQPGEDRLDQDHEAPCGGLVYVSTEKAIFQLEINFDLELTVPVVLEADCKRRYKTSRAISVPNYNEGYGIRNSNRPIYLQICALLI